MNRGLADPQKCSGFLHSNLSPFGALALSIWGDGLLLAQVANAGTGPIVAPTRRLAGPVEDRGDAVVGHLARQHANKVDNVGRCAPAVLPSAVLLNLKRRVVTTVPVDHEVKRLLTDANYDLIN